MSGQELSIVHQVDRALQRLDELADQARDYAAAAKADNTKRAYASDWRHFTAWCVRAGLDELPASGEAVALYLTSHAGQLKTSTLQRRLSAISQAHRLKSFKSPTSAPEVQLVWAGIRRTHGTAQVGKAPARVEDVRNMINKMTPERRGQSWRLPELRDRALLLVGFAGAFRRSELVSLNVEDLEFLRLGVAVHLRRSKTDQEGQGRPVGIPHGQHAETCPVRALQAYLTAAGIEAGPVFRSITRHGKVGGRLSDRAVALVVQKRAKAIDLNPKLLAGHSLRAGLATSAAAVGVSELAIMKQTGHRSVAMVRRYIRDGELFRDNAAGAVGL